MTVRVGRRGSALWLQGLACGAVLVVAPAALLLAAVLLLPAAITLALDRTPGRRLSRAVLLAGAAFTLEPVWRLWVAGGEVAAALDLIGDPAVLLPAWLAGALAWALCELLPVALRAWWDWRAAAEVAALKAERERIRQAWDL